MTTAIFIIQILNSLLYASALFLLAAGLSLIFGVMRILNMAHGSLYALGAYITAGTVTAVGFSVAPIWLIAIIPMAAVLVGLLGMAIEPTLLRPFYKRSEEYQLLLTFGLLLILEDSLLIVGGPYPISADRMMDAFGVIKIWDLIYPAYNLVVIAIGACAAIGLWLFVYHSKFGTLLRATSQDMRMAAGLGLHVGRLYVIAFGIGCFMAGLGGAIIVPTQAAVLGMGVENLVLAFVVVVIGGLGSLKGALVGALIVAFVRTAGVQFFPEIELAVLYLIAVTVLLWRPTGLFGTT